MNFRFTDFEINTERQELRRAGVIVHVEPQVFDLLVHLIQNRDRIVTKDELIDAIWHGRIVSEATLSSRINAARRALGDTGNDQSLIRTLYKRGFRFVGDVSKDTFAPAAHAVEKEALLQGAGHAAADLVLTGEPLPLPDKSSIAVLSFQNMRSCPDHERLADSLNAAASPRRRFPTACRLPPRSMRHCPVTTGLTLRRWTKGWRRPGRGRHETCCLPAR